MKDYLDVKNLVVEAPRKEGVIKLVDGVSFILGKGEILGIVGESGSGKTITCTAILGLLPTSMKKSASVLKLEGQSLLSKTHNQICGNLMSMIFQDPAAALNPVFTVRSQINAVLKRHSSLSAGERRKRLHQLLIDVGLPDPVRVAASFPHELSGGMQQRVLIAMALSTGAKLLIADEPTTALDVTVQAQILELLSDLRERLGLSIIFISHDLAVISQVCDRVAVMLHGKIVEHGEVGAVLGNPQHEYTQALLASSLGQHDVGSTLPTIAASQFMDARYDK